MNRLIPPSPDVDRVRVFFAEVVVLLEPAAFYRMAAFHTADRLRF